MNRLLFKCALLCAALAAHGPVFCDSAGATVVRCLLPSVNDPEDPSTSITQNYDGNGNLLSFTDANLRKTIRYAYDAAGRRSSLTTPEGTTLSYTYDASGRLAGIGLNGSPVAQYQYRGNGVRS